MRRLAVTAVAAGLLLVATAGSSAKVPTPQPSAPIALEATTASGTYSEMLTETLPGPFIGWSTLRMDDVSPDWAVLIPPLVIERF